MTTHASCTFSVQTWDEKTFTDGEGELKLTDANVVTVLQGDLEGKSVIRYLMFYGPREQTRVVGLERVTGKLGGKSGSFVLEHSGADDGNEARTRTTILAGSGTGELSGILGEGEMVATRAGDCTMTLDYQLG